jgi:hypothetical protein
MSEREVRKGSDSSIPFSWSLIAQAQKIRLGSGGPALESGDSFTLENEGRIFAFLTWRFFWICPLP